jgi:F-type H+-transporting ATPase subunit b
MLDFSVTFIVTIINITILFFILRAILFKPVTKFMEARSAKVRESLEQAENEKAQAKELLSQYEAKLRAASEEAAAIVRRAEERARAEADRILAEGKDAAERLMANSRARIEAEQRAAMVVFRTEAAALVVAASARLLRREVQAGDSRQYAGLLLQELGDSITGDTPGNG